MTIKEFAARALENWPAKVVCLTLALLLFLFYRMSTLERKFFSIPLEVVTNGDIVPAAQYPKTIKVSVRGEAERIYPVQESDLSAFVDLSSFSKEGEYSVPVHARLRGGAQDIDTMEVILEPAELRLRLEHRVVKRLPVVPQFRGYPEAGFEFAGFLVNPEFIEVSGPRSLMDSLKELATEQIDLAGRNAGFEGSVSLANRNSLISTGTSGKIEYRVTIAQTTLVRTFEDVPFYFENLDPSFEVDVDLIAGSLQIKGSQAELSGWALPENAMTVLCENVRSPGVYSLPVHVIVPETMEVVSSSPENVQMTVTRRAP
jgi:YbbR domain-containing protein